MPPVLPGRLPRMRERCTAMCNVATCAQAFAPLSALPLRTDRTGAVSCRSGVRAAACAMDMAGAQSMLLAAAKVAAEAAEDAEEVVEEVAARGAPAISIVGKTVGGNILVVVPIVGALVVFSVIAYILTQTLYLPPGTFDPSDDRKSQ